MAAQPGVKDDTWKLTAGTAVGWKFTYWSKGDDASQYSTAQTLTAESVTEATTYYAHYEPVYITGITSVKAYTNGPGSTAAGTGTGLAAGASVTVAVKYTANGDGVADSCIAVYAGGLDEVKAAVEAGTASPLAEQTFDGRLDNTTANLVVPKWPADLEKLTAVAGYRGQNAILSGAYRQHADRERAGTDLSVHAGEQRSIRHSQRPAPLRHTGVYRCG